MLRLNHKIFLIGLSAAAFAFHSLASEPKTKDKVIVPRRISAEYVDMGNPQTIYMVPGMATLIELPTPIHKIRVGNPNDVQYTKPHQPENEITLFLKHDNAKPTNLFLISGKNKYIFDIKPSKKVHQDYVEIVGSYGGPLVSSL